MYKTFFKGDNPFELFILVNIMLVGAATGLELEFGENDEVDVDQFVEIITYISTTVFTLEVVLKLVSGEVDVSACTFLTEEQKKDGWVSA